MWLITDASLEDLVEKRVSSDAFLGFNFSKLLSKEFRLTEVPDQNTLTYALFKFHSDFK